MNERDLLGLLDSLPMGVIWVNQAQISWLSRLVRERIAADPTDFAEYCNTDPALAALVYAGVIPPGGRIALDNYVYYPVVQNNRSGRLILLLDEGYTATLHPDSAQLQQTLQVFEEIYRSSFDGIFVADGNGVCQLVNEGCERNYGIKAEELVGKHVSEFEKRGWIRPVIAGKVIASRQRITATQQTHEGKTIMVTGIPLMDEAGQVRRVIINSRDTTELVQLQEDLARAQESLQRFEGELQALRRDQLKIEGVVLQSDAMQQVANLAMRVAAVDTTVLISGQSGVGKEVVAQILHRESHRAGGPFIKINCGALPRDLLESELFGYEAGAFTGAGRQGKPGMFELANGGTLFLDEVGELPLDLQVKLLLVIQDRTLIRLGGTRSLPIDVRLIAATNRDLQEMVAQKAFRSDLYYRLNVVPITVPPLAARPDDILPLIRHFATVFNRQYGLHRQLSDQATARLLQYSWPGNVREVKNVVERLIVTCPDELIRADYIDTVLPGSISPPADGGDFHARVCAYERSLLEDALRVHGSTRAVARALGLSQSSVVRKLRRQD